MIVDFDADATVLTSTIQAVPDASFSVANVAMLAPDEIYVAVWVNGCAFDDLESALDSDRTITDYNVISSTDNRRLYRLTLQPEVPEATAYRALITRDGVPVRITLHGGVWRVKTQFPSREDYNAFKTRTSDAGLDINEQAVYSEDPFGPAPYYGLTKPQYETLIAAIELGYFSIPRDASLARLANHLDISPNAASERLRRAIETLVEHTLIRDHDDLLPD